MSDENKAAMKILYHHRTLGDGAEGIHITEMVRAFRSLGHEVVMCGPAAGSENRAEAVPGRFSALKRLFRGPAYECLEMGYNLAGFLALARAVRCFRPDLIYDRYITYNASAVAAGWCFKVPVFLEVNAPLAYERAFESDERLYFKRLALFFEKITASCGDKTIVVSTPLKDHLVAMGVPAKKIFVLPNGVNPDTFSAGPKPEHLGSSLGIDPSHTVIGFTGILRPWHGLDMLVAAFAGIFRRHEKARLLLVGDGTIRTKIEQQAETLGCRPGLVITGRVPHGDVKDYIRLFDIAVSPKTTFYASPMKIPEYMAMGKPVVAPKSPNITDLLDDGETGLLFVPEDADSLEQALGALMADGRKRERMGAAALEKARSGMTWERNAQRVVALLKKRPARMT